MSAMVAKVVAAAGFATIAALLALRFRIGLSREIGVAALRAGVQLAVVGAAIALVFRYPALSLLFVAVMLGTAGLTAGGRLRGLPGARRRALVAIAVPALGATGALLLVGAFELTPRSGVPTAGILIGGALTATTLTGRRLLESLAGETNEIEARLCLGDDARTALAPAVRRAVTTGLIPVIDQTRSVGLVTLPGTFVGLILGGATPAEAAATQLVVLLALLAVQIGAGLLLAELTQRALILPGERIAPLALQR
ncbi:MAG: UDP-glucose/iron transport system permease protein [Solirubrobacteraceae bacterium]|nr:UDP-glucose/iron transport system permease protein [Solirubrobacteraceae bacterium]